MGGNVVSHLGCEPCENKGTPKTDLVMYRDSLRQGRVALQNLTIVFYFFLFIYFFLERKYPAAKRSSGKG